MDRVTYFVPVDFSSCSLNALQYATMLARHAGGKVVLNHVIDLDEVPESENPVVVSWTLDRMTRSAQEKMNSLREMISLEGIPVEEDISMGNVKLGVVKQIDKVKPTVIVLGRNTEREPGKTSMLTHISRNTRVPVLVVPGSHNPRIPNKALLATDMKSFRLKDVAPLINIIRKTAQQLAVLNVKSNGNDGEAKIWIEKLNATFDLDANLITTDHLHARRGIKDAIHENKVDLLFAIQQDGLLRRLFHDDLLPLAFQASVPVLLVRK